MKKQRQVLMSRAISPAYLGFQWQGPALWQNPLPAHINPRRPSGLQSRNLLLLLLLLWDIEGLIRRCTAAKQLLLGCCGSHWRRCFICGC